MWYFWFLGGVIAGSIMSSIWYWLHSSTGTLKIDHSNPEKDIYRICIDRFDDLSKKKRINLKVDHNADLSQD